MLHTIKFDYYEFVKLVYGYDYDNVNDYPSSSYSNFEADLDLGYSGIQQFYAKALNEGHSHDEIKDAYNSGYETSICDDDFKELRKLFIDDIVKSFKELPDWLNECNGGYQYTWKWTGGISVEVINDEIIVTTNLNNLLLLIAFTLVCYSGWGGMNGALGEICGMYLDCKTELGARRKLNSLKPSEKLEVIRIHLHWFQYIRKCDIAEVVFNNIDASQVNYFGTNGSIGKAIEYASEELGLSNQAA
jgi:hypothetical protein